MPARRPTVGSTRRRVIRDIGRVGLQMSGMPGVKNIAENIGHMRERALQNIYRDLLVLSVEMEVEAQDMAHRVYESHPKRHNTERYPNEDVAADSIVSSATRSGPDRLSLSLRYPAEVVMMTKEGRRVTYGGILEANVHGETAAVKPTWEEFQPEFMAIMSGALNRYGSEPRPRRSRQG